MHECKYESVKIKQLPPHPSLLPLREKEQGLCTYALEGEGAGLMYLCS
jgi:hypothetical protein